MDATVIPFRPRTAAPAPADAEVALQRAAAVEAGFSADRLVHDSCEHCWADAAHEVLDHVEELLHDGHEPAEVVALCQRAVSCLERAAPDIRDDAPLTALAARIGAVHLRACEAARPDPVELARWLFDVEVHGDLGAVAGASERYADVLGAAGLAEYRRLADAAWARTSRRTGIAQAIERFRLEPIMASLARARHPSLV